MYGVVTIVDIISARCPNSAITLTRQQLLLETELALVINYTIIGHHLGFITIEPSKMSPTDQRSI